MPSRPSRFTAAALVSIALSVPILGQGGTVPSQERGPEPASPESVQAAIDALSNLDFSTRLNAARTLRRAPAETVAPALIRAVESHKDQYVRFKALVLLTAFADARTPDLIREVASNPNDRLRTVAYMYFEHHPVPTLIPSLLTALEREESEFVRPALIRALAAHAQDPRVQKTLLVEVDRGQDFFRSGVIEAMGDFHAAYAVAPLMNIARLTGPLQADAVIALGKLKDPKAMETLAALQRTATRELQPPIAAAICLLGVNCDAHLPFLVDTLKFADKNPGHQPLLRNAVAGLVALATSGNAQALGALVETGMQAVDPPRAPMALGIGTIAIRNTPLMLKFLESAQSADGAVELIAEGFDMLEEDYEEERFFADVRRGYWQAAEGSATRRVGQALIEKLEF
jgi:HEAT repeat protein